MGYCFPGPALANTLFFLRLTNLGTGKPLSACNWAGEEAIKVLISNAKNSFSGPLTKPRAIIVWFSCCMVDWWG